MRLFSLAIAVPAVLLLATSCNPFDVLFGTGPPAGNTPGTYSVFGVAHYAAPDMNNFILSPPDALADDFKSRTDFYHWSATSNSRNDDVTASRMIAAEATSDMMFFAGHGDEGLMQLYYGEIQNSPPDRTSWGPGATNHQYQANLNGFPVQGKLKWLLAYSSFTAAPPAFLYPDRPDTTTNWLPAFGGSLHGLYGFAARPLPNGGKTNDVSTKDGDRFVAAFLTRAMSVNPSESVHSSWINGARDASIGDLIGIWEDQSNTGDIMSADSSGLNFAPSGNIWYFWVQNNFEYETFAGSPKSIGNETFTLQPAGLSAEQLNDSTMLSNAQSTFGNPDTYTNDGSVSIATRGATTTTHNLATGALSFHGVAQVNPFVYSQDDAYSSAVSAVQNTGTGLPSDALLTRIDANTKADPATGGSVILGYTFTWRHANQPFGNDAIVATVDDEQTRTRTCTGGYDVYYDSVGRPHNLCMGWTTTITNSQNISYLFRMWRARGNFRSVQSLGQTSLTAATAAASLPPGSVVYDYTQGFWTGTFNDTTNSVAEPAWVFTLIDGTQIYVDAYSGVVLQSIRA